MTVSYRARDSLRVALSDIQSADEILGEVDGGWVGAVAIAASQAPLDLSQGAWFNVTLPTGVATALVVRNATVGQRFTVRLLQDGTGSGTVTWFTTIRWPGGTVPTLTATANKADTFVFACLGVNQYDGYIAGQNL